VVGQGLKLNLIRVSIGLVVAAAATRVLSILLYGISPTDHITFAGVLLLRIATAAAASNYISGATSGQGGPVAWHYE